MLSTFMGRTSPLTTEQWQSIERAAIAGTPFDAIISLFPTLNHESLKKRAQRYDWPIPGRVARHISRQPKEGQINVPENVPSTQKGTKIVHQGTNDEQKLSMTALEMTVKAAKEAGMKTLAGLTHKTAAALDAWTVPTPETIQDGATLARMLSKISGNDASQGNTTNVQVAVSVGPWTRQENEVAFIEAETVEDDVLE